MKLMYFIYKIITMLIILSIKNINKNKDILVVYFSRMGYTKKIAYDYANEVGAFILKLNTLENTSGTLGFWWYGRFSTISNIL